MVLHKGIIRCKWQELSCASLKKMGQEAVDVFSVPGSCHALRYVDAHFCVQH